MQMTRLWHAYVAAYAFAMAIPFLLFPNAVPFIHYAPADLVWVRLTGMCLAGYAYFNCSLIRERHLPSMRANVVNQAIGTVCIGTLALITGSTALDAVAVVIVVGFIGMALSFQMERGAFTPRPTPRFPRTARWNWYVAGYTFFYTIATGVFPHQILPIVGFADPVLPWERVTGMLFLVLCVFNVVVAREQGTGPVMLAILTLRIWFVGVLIVMGLLGYPWFVFLSAVIVGVGVAGTIVTYRRERQATSGRPATATAR